MESQGLLIIYTGNGKGKTTAALGQAVRAAGHGLKVCIIQFIKNQKATGEAKAMQGLLQEIEFHTTGSGFTWKAKDRQELCDTARQGWGLAKEKINSRQYDLVILDEFTYVMNHRLINEAEIMETLACLPSGLHLVITGRQASSALVEQADLVTEMQEIKHPYRSGIKAQKGIEY